MITKHDMPTSTTDRYLNNYTGMGKFILMVLIIGSSALESKAFSQEILGDVLSGKLVNPEVGVYAWYTLEDRTEERLFFLRQAIVGEERVRLRRGYWVETEIVPQVGYPAIYKMLLTGPASDPANVHKIMLKEGLQEVQEIDVARLREEQDEIIAPKRTLVGTELLDLSDETIETDRYILEKNGLKTELWINDKVRPLGIIKLVTPDGELKLLRYGKGGVDGLSAFDRADIIAQPEDVNRTDIRVHTEVEDSGPTTNFRGRTQD